MANPGDPTNLAGFAAGTWPPNGSPGPAQDTMRIFVGQTAGRVLALPQSGVGVEGQPGIFKADGTGLTAAGAAGVSAIDCAGLPVVNNQLATVTVGGSIGITSRLHLGRLLHYVGTTSINLTVNLDATGAAGVADGFHCVILRSYDSGSSGQVHVVLGPGLTLQRADGNRGCAGGFPVGVAVLGGRLYLTGGVVA